MSCCSHKRNAFKNASYPVTSIVESQLPKANHSFKGIFMGRRGKVIQGMITGKQYHFRFKGHVLAIDERDASGLGAEGDIEILKIE